MPLHSSVMSKEEWVGQKGSGRGCGQGGGEEGVGQREEEGKSGWEECDRELGNKRKSCNEV